MPFAPSSYLFIGAASCLACKLLELHQTLSLGKCVNELSEWHQTESQQKRLWYSPSEVISPSCSSHIRVTTSIWFPHTAASVARMACDPPESEEARELCLSMCLMSSPNRKMFPPCCHHFCRGVRMGRNSSARDPSRADSRLFATEALAE